MLDTIEVNDELGWLIRSHLQGAGVEEKVRLHIGDAAQIIPTLEAGFDLVFLDAGKLDYAQTLLRSLPKRDRAVLYWLIMYCGMAKWPAATKRRNGTSTVIS